MKLKDNWIKDRTNSLRAGSTIALVRLAEDNGIQIDDLTSVEHLTRQIAEAEWVTQSKFPAIMDWAERKGSLPSEEDFAVTTAGYEAPNAEQPWKGYPLADVTGVPFEEGVTWPEKVTGPTSGPTLTAKPGPQPQTSSGYFIYEVLLPEFLERFFAKNADYGDQHRTGLGTAAEFVGIHRKVEKLKTALWDGQEMNGEGPREMLFDLIGQCFIILDLMAQEENK
jgi:hypothetical protein